MRRFAAVLVFGFVAAASAQTAPAPEQCLRKAQSPFAVAHAGKTYFLANEACRAQFLTDPERFSQLYDALAQLEAEGGTIRPASPSLVPS